MGEMHAGDSNQVCITKNKDQVENRWDIRLERWVGPGRGEPVCSIFQVMEGLFKGFD